MLILNRMIHPYEVRKCKLSGKFIKYGDFYYEDDEDGVCVLASEYKKLQDAKRREEFDYSELERCQSQVEYEQLMKKAEREYLYASILDRQIIDNGQIINTSLSKE